MKLEKSFLKVKFKKMKFYETGSVSLSHETQRSLFQRTNEAIAWMTNYFDLVGDYLPHHMAIHLPSLTKLHVYQKMVTEFKERNKDNIIAQSNFFRDWEHHFPNITIPKASIIVTSVKNISKNMK